MNAVDAADVRLPDVETLLSTLLTLWPETVLAFPVPRYVAAYADKMHERDEEDHILKG